MRICAVSPLCFPYGETDDYYLSSSVKLELLNFLNGLHHDLIVLPGYLRGYPSVEDIQNNIRPGVVVFMELGSMKTKKMESTPMLISRRKILVMHKQIFGINPGVKELRKLTEIWPERSHFISGKNVSFIMCGEVDAFAKDGLVKHGFELDFEVLINPTHTLRGRWNHLGEKLENLSKQGKAVIHVANNTRENLRITTGVRIYIDGEILPRNFENNLAWSECDL